MKDLKLSHYQPGAIGRITELHALYYHKNSGFGLFFESKIATEMSDFLNRMDLSRDGFWTAISKEKVIGSIAIDGIKSKSDGNHLRWFIVDPAFQNKGVGTMLIKKALEFCKKGQTSRVYLWTFSRLDAARHLYEKFGFTLVKEQEGTTWGVKVKEQLFELIL